MTADVIIIFYSSPASGKTKDEADEKSQQRSGWIRRRDGRHVQRVRL